MKVTSVYSTRICGWKKAIATGTIFDNQEQLELIQGWPGTDAPESEAKECVLDSEIEKHRIIMSMVICPCVMDDAHQPAEMLPRPPSH
jgi:hypothetical protein